MVPPIVKRVKYIDSIHIVHRRKDGTIVSERTINNGLFHRFLCKLGLRHNSMLNGGLAALAALSGGIAGPGAVRFIGIGTGTVAVNVTDTWLGSAKSVQSATNVTRVTTSVANDTLQLEFTFGSAGGQGSLTGTSQVSEVIAADGTGAAGHTSSGTHIATLRQVYTPVDNCEWANGDTLKITIKMQSKQGA